MKDISYINDIRTREILKKVENRMIELFQEKLSKIILYGSYARNQSSFDSDIDIMILVNDKECNLKKYEETITEIIVDLSLEYKVVLSLYTQSTYEYEKQVNVLPFLMNIQREGIRIYG